MPWRVAQIPVLVPLTRQLARSGDGSDLVAAAGADALIERAQRARLMHDVPGGLDQRPARRRKPGSRPNLQQTIHPREFPLALERPRDPAMNAAVAGTNARSNPGELQLPITSPHLEAATPYDHAPARGPDAGVAGGS
jgi:hypothetical protein